MGDAPAFEDEFAKLLRVEPFSWQRRLFGCLIAGDLPAAIDLPTGLGKTSVMAIWLIARAHRPQLPRRLVYVVDRRAVVDQATAEAEKLREGLDCMPHLKRTLDLGEGESLPISTLRGQFVDNRDWRTNPAKPAIIVGTVDMIGSRLLFSGYGVSPKMRPYHAGLLGADALIVLDEAHLVPPFEKLLEAIETGTDVLGPRTEDARKIIPSFKLLSLSATGRERQGDVFRLLDEDFGDAVVKQRLDASKRLKLEAPLATSDLADAMTVRAWEHGFGGRRVIVFCNSRKTAQKVHDDLKEKLKKNFKEIFGKPDADLTEAIELVVGARRVHEREELANSGAFRRFSPKAQDEWSIADGVPAFLVCTSAGEVGVDMDADHMVCDLVAWERMVQRLGRVNRLGKFAEGSLIDVFPVLSEKDKEAEITINEARLATWRAPFDSALWPVEEDGRRNASPGILRQLHQNEQFRLLTDAATTPAPLRPALTRPLVDAWSMTSLEKHTGRPDIAPWLRGWVEDEPQTSVVWRKYLPVRLEGSPASEKEIADFFEAAPPHMSEKLETETWRVVEWLMERASILSKCPAKETNETDVERSPQYVDQNDIVAFTLGSASEQSKYYRLANLVVGAEAKKLKDRLEGELSGATLIVDVRLKGLVNGLLDEMGDVDVLTADDGNDWPDVRFRVHPPMTPEAAKDTRREPYIFVTKMTPEGDAKEVIVIETSTTEDSRATAIRPQLLSEHRSLVEQCSTDIAEALKLTGDHKKALEIAARLHDEGKKAWRWQRAFNASRDGVYAKTKGPINQALLDSYRHEFGSLPYVEKDAEFEKLSDDLQDLILHMVAAHHGGARPVISTKSCDDAPPSALEARARDVALRFARLQKIWGPWGLAWWESLLRAADQQASHENDAREAPGGTAPDEEAA